MEFQVSYRLRKKKAKKPRKTRIEHEYKNERVRISFVSQKPLRLFLGAKYTCTMWDCVCDGSVHPTFSGESMHLMDQSTLQCISFQTNQGDKVEAFVRGRGAMAYANFSPSVEQRADDACGAGTDSRLSSLAFGALSFRESIFSRIRTSYRGLSPGI